MNLTNFKTPLETLQSTFGYPSFRHRQDEIIDTTLAGKDVLVVMPTGGGKSLCYQIPALINPGLTVVISPLIALMKDQVDALRLTGIPAAYLNSSLTTEERNEVFHSLRNNQLKLLYLAPERLLGNEQQFISFLQNLNISLFAIDEAHCISHWGHDFRPEYRMLSTLKQSFPEVPTMALTATADELTRRDIIEKLQLRSPEIFLSSFNRPNIHYYIEPKANSHGRLLTYLDRHKGDSGIIYTLSRNSAESLATTLELEGFSVKPYHAGLEPEVRKRNQELFVRDEVKIIVATIAFGMGINKSNVRFVIHADLPKNIESYYQETGRAGRDGLKSEAILFYSPADIYKLQRFAMIEGNPAQTRIMLHKLSKMAEFCESLTCRRKMILNYFGEEFPAPNSHCEERERRSNPLANRMPTEPNEIASPRSPARNDNGIREFSCESCDVCMSEIEYFDGTIIVQKALSAVARLQGTHGVSYLIDFLRGSQSEKIKPEHKSLPTYGIGVEFSKDTWHRYIRELIARGYIHQTQDEYPVVKLTQKSVAVLNGQERIELVKSIKKQFAAITEQPHDEELFNLLKERRAEFAREENLPAYLIFSDATLLELATYLPQNIEEIRKISGFGEAKTKRYGEQFLPIITEYCNEHNLSSKMNTKSTKEPTRERSSATKGLSATKLETIELFLQGKTVYEIAERRDLSPQTVEGHIADGVGQGRIEITQVVSEEKIEKITAVIKESDTELLAPLKQVLGEEVSYGEIKAVIAHVRKTKI
jgi:ATP-dependent DNA helicase RecQ